MPLHFRICTIALLIVVTTLMQASHRTQAAIAPSTFKAGLAKVVITPEKNIWMAGYAARNKPAEGKLQDLYARALAIEDGRGNRVVLVTTDLLGLPRALTSENSEHANKSYGLKREIGGNVWVAGYSNDLCSYIPSARMSKEGGYEVIDSMIYYDLPGPYTPEIEEKIVGKVRELTRKFGTKK